jgi:hypothetical protein
MQQHDVPHVFCRSKGAEASPRTAGVMMRPFRCGKGTVSERSNTNDTEICDGL